MKLRYFLIASVGIAAGFAACVGDDPTSTQEQTDGSTTPTDGQVNSEASTADSACVPNCGSSCVNLDGDGKNCGTCGHDCLGGNCSSGVCQPRELFSGKSTDASVGGVAAIVIDSAQIFWLTPALSPPETKANGIPSTISRCAVGGDCTVPAIVWQQSGEIDSLVASPTGGHLFFNDSTATVINRMSSSGVDAGASLGLCSGGGSPCTDVSNILDIDMLAMGATDVYAGSNSNHGTAGEGQISFGPTNGSGANSQALSNVVSGNPASTALALDDAEGFVYAAMSNGTIYIYSTMAPPVGPTNTVTGQSTVGQMAVANGFVFWTNPSLGKVFAIAHCVGTSCGNGAPSPITPQTFASTPAAQALSADAKNIYWSAGGQIFSCSLNGCVDAGPTMLANGTVTVRAIANDATSIYWGDDQGSIWQLAK